jgi:hypothetical protein
MESYRNAIKEPIDQGRKQKDFLFFKRAKVCYPKQGTSPLKAQRFDLFNIFLKIHHGLNFDF